MCKDVQFTLHGGCNTRNVNFFGTQKFRFISSVAISAVAYSMAKFTATHVSRNRAYSTLLYPRLINPDYENQACTNLSILSYWSYYSRHILQLTDIGRDMHAAARKAVMKGAPYRWAPASLGTSLLQSVPWYDEVDVTFIHQPCSD